MFRLMTRTRLTKLARCSRWKSNISKMDKFIIRYDTFITYHMRFTGVSILGGWLYGMSIYDEDFIDRMLRGCGYGVGGFFFGILSPIIIPTFTISYVFDKFQRMFKKK